MKNIPMYVYLLAYLLVNTFLPTALWFTKYKDFTTYVILAFNWSVFMVVVILALIDLRKARKNYLRDKEVDRLGGVKKIQHNLSKGLRAWEINGGVVWAATKRAAKRKAQMGKNE